MNAYESDPLDVWLRIPDGEEEAEAEANTYMDFTRYQYRVDWYLTAVGMVKSAFFPTLAEAHDWLEEQGFADFTS